MKNLLNKYYILIISLLGIGLLILFEDVKIFVILCFLGIIFENACRNIRVGKELLEEKEA